MNRFHVHVAVQDLGASVTFYTKLFGQPPSKSRDDYAKWMLDDPRLNFAISNRGHGAGLNHFGMQVDTPGELERLKALADDASAGATMDEGQASCCYAKSEKHWTVDPQGIAWEHFHTLEEADTYGVDTAVAAGVEAGACCIPLHPGGAEETSVAVAGMEPVGVSEEAAVACCVPRDAARQEAGCC